VTQHLPLPVQGVCEILGAILGILFFGLVCWGSFDPAWHAWTSNEFEGEGALRVPAWPARFIVVLGTFLAACNYALLAIERVRAFGHNAPDAG
jgi:TRAP-type C4-dicarboxylate transport system permease small subunit